MVLTIDFVLLSVFVALLFIGSKWFDTWSLFSYDFVGDKTTSAIKLGATVLAALLIHFSVRRFSAQYVARKLETALNSNASQAGSKAGDIASSMAGNIKSAFLKNTQGLRSIFRPVPVGWSMRTRRTLAQVTADASDFIQTMNDRYTRPSGKDAAASQSEEIKAAVEH